MSENTKSGGGLSGIVGFVVIVAIWSGVNYWRTGSNLNDACKNDMSMNEAFCSCFKSKVQSEIGLPSYLPLVGRFLKPSDEEVGMIGMTAGAQCMVPE